MLASTPTPPYYAVIFTSTRTEGDNGYNEMAERMLALAQQQEGFIGIETAREAIGITVSYWQNVESIKKWRENLDHSIAQEKGKTEWYQSFKTRICKVERDYGFEK